MSKRDLEANLSSSQEEIRFVKDQQWKPVYYPLVLFSSIVVIFSQGILASTNPYYGVLKVLAMVLIALVALVSMVFQWLHFKALQEYRSHPAIGRTCGKTAVSLTITLMFNIVTLIGATFGLVYLLTLSTLNAIALLR
jgi:hypothetical protein